MGYISKELVMGSSNCLQREETGPKTAGDDYSYSVT